VVHLTPQMPTALKSQARWEWLADQVPALLVHPTWAAGHVVPAVIWMHGRTATKELDPGRYLRLLRSGIGVCAVDLPGHGERYDETLQDPKNAFAAVAQMIDEIDPVTQALKALGGFDVHRLGIGGMSAGGMAALARLCHQHPFRCASVEASTGSWRHQKRRLMFSGVTDDQVAHLDPIRNLQDWRPIPLQAIHSRLDAWVPVQGQIEFLEALRKKYDDPRLIEFVQYPSTGAPMEHAGFGRLAADAKNRQQAFFTQCLLDVP
jgi:dienelactone hydrolase